MFKKSSILIALSILGLLMFASCSTMNKGYHGLIMRGVILESTGKDVYLCIGSKDGAKAGDELDVYKNVRVTVDTKNASKEVWAKEKTGTVKIHEIVNEHYSKGMITSGKAEVGSIVESK